jgi:hypothetical protein
MHPPLTLKGVMMTSVLSPKAGHRNCPKKS